MQQGFKNQRSSKCIIAALKVIRRAAQDRRGSNYGGFFLPDVLVTFGCEGYKNE